LFVCRLIKDESEANEFQSRWTFVQTKQSNQAKVRTRSSRYRSHISGMLNISLCQLF
jgi:hypothetical protein